MKKNLVHNTLLAISVSVLHWVKLIHETWLLGSAYFAMACTMTCGRAVCCVGGGANGTTLVVPLSGS